MASDRTAGEYRAALEAVREALGIPYAATTGEDAKRTEILKERVMHALVMVEAVLGDGHSPVAWYVAYLRDRLAEHPAHGYRTWDQAVAELQAAKTAAITLPGSGS
jgi:hypothetical protein